MDILTAIGHFTTSVLSYDPSKIIVGRFNYEQVDFSDDIIIIDNLISLVVGQTETYDGTTETMTYGSSMKSVITLTFYGANSMNNAGDFIVLCRSENAINEAITQGISYRFPSSMTNLGAVTGTQNHNKYQIELTVFYTNEKVIDTMYIDTAEITFLVNK